MKKDVTGVFIFGEGGFSPRPFSYSVPSSIVFLPHRVTQKYLIIPVR